MRVSGRLITMEGLDGCGKSTQLRLLSEHLERQGIHALVTQEPGGTPLGRQLRDLIVHAAPGESAPLTELAVMFAARAQHIEQVILPALRSGRIVLSDRFTDSSFAYQGYGHGVPLETVRTLETLLCQGVRPDLTLLLDVESRTSASRAAQRNQGAQQPSSRFEREDLEFFQRVREGYREIAQKEPQRVKMIDGEVSLAEVHRSIIEQVAELLQGRQDRGDAHGI